MSRKCKVIDLGIVNYLQAYDIQKECVKDVSSGKEARVLICEHPSVFTLGRLASDENFLCSCFHRFLLE